MLERSYRLKAIECPVCRSNSLRGTDVQHHVEHVGPVLLSTIICEKCGYTNRDVVSLLLKDPQVITAYVENPADLYLKVIRSSSAVLKIPELGVSINPGPMAEGFISNVKGVLDRVEQVAKTLMETAQGARKETCLRLLRKISEARSGKMKFRLILKDPYGKSSIAPTRTAKILTRKLTSRETKRLSRNGSQSLSVT